MEARDCIYLGRLSRGCPMLVNPVGDGRNILHSFVQCSTELAQMGGKLTFTISPGMLRSLSQAGIEPPGVEHVAILQRSADE